MGIRNTINKLALKVYKNRGDIAFFGGMALTAVGTGLFVKAGMKQVEINEEHRESKKAALDANNDDQQRLLKENNHGTLTRTVKNFAAPVAVSAVGYGLEIYGRSAYKSDLAKASVALNAITAAYEAVKAKVIETEGADKWAEYADGVKVSHWQEGDLDGNVVDKTEVEFDENRRQPHTYLFYEPNPNWSPAKGCSKAFLLSKLNELEFKLKRKGFLLEIDILDSLGEDPEHIKHLVKIGAVSTRAGIVYDESRPFERQVSFGLDFPDEATRRFMDELEPSVLLRFNCVDNILDYI